MNRTWQLQEAKDKFSEVVKEALRSGPQLITKRGEKAVILLSYAEYRKLTLAQQKLSAFFRESPLAEVTLGLSRDVSDARPEPVL